MTGGAEGLPGDPALGVLLLILLCKRNGAWDPAPAGLGVKALPPGQGEHEGLCKARASVLAVCPWAGLPSLEVGKRDPKEECQGWGGPEAVLGRWQPAPLLPGAAWGHGREGTQCLPILSLLS